MWIALVAALFAAPSDPEASPDGEATEEAEATEEGAEETPVEEPGREYVATVVLSDDVLTLQADGTVTLERNLTLTIPEPPALEEGEEEEPADEPEEGEEVEDPGQWLTVRLAHPVVSADGLTVVGDDVVARSSELRDDPVAVLDTQMALGEIDVVREQLRQDIEAAEDRLKQDDVQVRPDLDLLESLVAGADSVAPVPADERAEEHIAWLTSQLERATTAATLILDGEPVVHHWVDVHVDSLAPGDYAMALTSVVPDASWVSGYVLNAPPELGAVESDWVAGLSVPADVGFEEVTVHVDWGHGPVPAVQSPTTLIAGTELHPITLAELPNTYRNIVGTDDAVQRRVDVSNPFEHPLPQTRATLSTTVFSAAALEPEETFRLGLGPATGWRVRRRGNEYDIRTNLPNPTPVWIPIDPTGCRIAASGDVQGMEEVDGNKGVTAMIGERGIVSVMCE